MDVIIYHGKAALILAVFYIFYRLLLSKETFHRFNRIVLLGTAALSFVLPLCVITVRKVVTLPQPTVIDEVVSTMNGMAAGVAETANVPLWPFVLCVIFALGAVSVLTMTVISIFKVKSIIRSGEHQTLESGETLVITENDTAPFSWMKYIVLSREDYENGYTQILTHEKAHIALRHSWDLLFVDLITAFQWFNPVIWMLKTDLRALHEFEADDAVLRSGANIKEYQYLLIRKAVSKSGYSVANSFNHSTLKARITMMLNKKSSRMSAWKALYVIPLVGISLAATAETKVDYRYEDQQPEAAADTPIGKDSKKTFKEKNLKEGHFIIDEENNAITMVYYGLDGKELQSQIVGVNLDKDWYFLNGAMATPAAFESAMESEYAVMLTAYLKNGKKVRGAVTPDHARFVSGIINIETEKMPERPIVIKEHKEEDKMVLIEHNDEIVYVINGEKMPKEFDMNTIDPDTIVSIQVLKTEDTLKEYGTDKGVIVITTDPSRKVENRPVPDVYIDGKKATSEEIATLPANPKGHIEADGTVRITTEDAKDDAGVSGKPESMPSFNGGKIEDFAKWVMENIRYPEGTTAEGRVAVSFTVSETGKVTDVKTLRGPDQKLNDEAVRVISSSPDWAPATDEDGKPIAIKLIIPVNFKK